MSSYQIEILGSGASIEDIRKAFSAPISELPKLSQEEIVWAESMKVPIEDYQRNRLAERYYEEFVKKVIDKLVTFIERELSKRSVHFVVEKVVCEFDRMIFRFHICVENETRSFHISWEDGTDFAEGNDMLAARSIRESLDSILKVSQ